MKYTKEERLEIYTELIEFLEHAKLQYNGTCAQPLFFKGKKVILLGLCHIVRTLYNISIYENKDLKENLPELYTMALNMGKLELGRWFPVYPYDFDSRIKMLQDSMELLNKTE